MLERNHLQILYEVERQGSLTAAAKTLCLTQSALSHSIKKLEAQLGIKIWYQQGRRLKLTEPGQALLRLAKRLLPQFELTETYLIEHAQGQRGRIRIGMECHPCYQWLLKVVSPFLEAWPKVDVDVKQQFRFGGMQALFDYDIDLLVTPDPLQKKGLIYQGVFDYEQVLVVSQKSHLAKETSVIASQLSDQVLITYPVEMSRLDIYSQFFNPAQCSPKSQKIIETTDIMLQMVAANRGVCALPKWLVCQYQKKIPLATVKLGKGINKQIFLGTRQADAKLDYLQSFITLAKSFNQSE